MPRTKVQRKQSEIAIFGATHELCAAFWLYIRFISNFCHFWCHGFQLLNVLVFSTRKEVVWDNVFLTNCCFHLHFLNSFLGGKVLPPYHIPCLWACAPPQYPLFGGYGPRLYGPRLYGPRLFHLFGDPKEAYGPHLSTRLFWSRRGDIRRDSNVSQGVRSNFTNQLGHLSSLINK